MSRESLPQDIILLICQELTWQRDFGTLFNCSLVSVRVASLALEQLYSIHELSPANTAETFNLSKVARLWKSLLLSSIGKTAYPYCTWIRSLSLGNYGSLLEDIWNNKAVDLLEPLEDMKQFLVLRGNQTWKTKITRNRGMPFFDFQRSMTESGDSLTLYIKQMADLSKTAVSLNHLEASSLPADLLPVWIARIPSLQSLQLQEASALTPEAASAIARWCPKFSEFVCLLCSGASADENVASFLQILPRDSLQCFEIISYNDIGLQTLRALNAHARSLKTLTLGSLPGDVMNSLNALPSCTAIEHLSLENQRHNPWHLAGNDNLLKQVVDWIGSCKNLRTLKLSNIGDSLLIIKDVLASPNVQLLALDLQGFSSQGDILDAAAWSALGRQEILEDLTIGGLDGMPDALVVHETPVLADSICQLRHLKKLDLKRASIRAIELRQIVTALPQLTNLGFGGEWIDDQILESVSNLQNLKSLLVNALSVFTFDGLRTFATKLDPEQHKGIVVEINNQIGKWKFDRDQEDWLIEYFTTELEGRIDIGVFKDPDEAHEDDFTSASD
ncbi:hypothetical protein PFICI_02787 [Pestalotiopsis fici W106-1]|uniref:F-box domain-containing protein n=1 Tax=Pestalotiopsis fici (strain W106-1 / CGMCC3.15140) TaxID=1229662 RepID=W3XH72_PESFW|nr:uncharacterized protein PFICI_02787 [Pestalotiopsis fici W106-1]ETS84762.1 hypothetical protein PFICI_02787 [Pestalotiopsis fici W106-1]